MRIAVINWTSRCVGGVETYLNTIVPELSRAGHQMAFWNEVDRPAHRDRIAMPDGMQTWCVADLGPKTALAGLSQWQPDLIYAHGLLHSKLEAATIKIAPSIFFAHNYYGTCISGSKTFKRPVVTPCDRRFGGKCLLQYYPRRCGGWSPLTMMKLFRMQSRRLMLLSSYKAIVTHSKHMREEYIKHGIEPERVFDLLYQVPGTQLNPPLLEDTPHFVNITTARGHKAPLESTTPNGHRPEWRLLFLGRMDFLKGGAIFLDALPQISSALKRPLRVTFGGDGPERCAWEQQSKRIHSRHPQVRIEFAGWLKGDELASLMSDCDLLILPSLWPEPFGLVGPEAGLHGVPVAAFAVGGIPSWLVDGFNGYVAPGQPPTAGGLAEAVINCLHDPLIHARLRYGAVEMAERFNTQNHMAALIKVFESVVSQSE